MALVRIFNPGTASEAAVVVALLEAHEIPAYLHIGHRTSMLPEVSSRRSALSDSCQRRPCIRAAA